jgi:hypothetical protein
MVGVLLTSLPALLAVAALTWRALGHVRPQSDYRIEGCGLLLSIAAVAFTAFNSAQIRRWYSLLTLAAALWFCALFFLASASY